MLFYFIYFILFIGRGKQTPANLWWLEDSLEEEDFSVHHHMGPGDPTQVIKLVGKCFHPLTHLGSNLKLSMPGDTTG